MEKLRGLGVKWGKHVIVGAAAGKCCTEAAAARARNGDSRGVSGSAAGFGDYDGGGRGEAEEGPSALPCWRKPRPAAAPFGGGGREGAAWAPATDAMQHAERAAAAGCIPGRRPGAESGAFFMTSFIVFFLINLTIKCV